MQLGKPLLPEWRFWPALAFAGFVALAAIGWSFEPPAQLQPQQSAKGEEWNFVQKALALFHEMVADDWIAVFTGLTAIIFYKQLRAMRRTNEHYAVTERAYVKMSHRDPGIRWETQNRLNFQISLQIKNYGRTPAKVTDVVVNFFVAPKGTPIDELPLNIRAKHIPKDTTAFLVTDDMFLQHLPFNVDDEAERLAVDDGKQQLIVFGYADYIDQFGTRHRAGYGRLYSTEWENNLIFPDRGPFNYDRVRKPGEGIDWDES